MGQPEKEQCSWCGRWFNKEKLIMWRTQKYCPYCYTPKMLNDLQEDRKKK